MKMLFVERPQSLLLQGNGLTSCRLEFELLFADSEPEEQLERAVRDIAATSAWLQEQALSVCISTRSVSRQTLPPAPAVLEQIAPFMRQLNYYTVQRELATSSLEDINRALRSFRPSHLMALQSASNLQTLCISDTIPVDGNHSLFPIPTFHSLTKLHLTYRQGQPDFQPLVSLNGLEDLALQCVGWSSSCHDVLCSSKHTLQQVTLASNSWDTETYAALVDLPVLLTLTVKVDILAPLSAQMLGDIPAPESVQIMLHKCTDMEPAAFRALSSGQAKI